MWRSRNACAMWRRVCGAKNSAPQTQACLGPGVTRPVIVRVICGSCAVDRATSSTAAADRLAARRIRSRIAANFVVTMFS